LQTQKICRDILTEVSKQAQWQSNIVEAIKRSHLEQSRDLLHGAPPARVHKNLSLDDKESIGRDVLNTLYFPEMEHRYEKITAAYQKTFNWVFHQPPEAVEWTDYSGWARNDESPLYWVTGKAGAGKSTLMRYIYDHPDTRAALKSWAADRPLINVSFFFWNSGSAMQMSHEGLVRALLYQILVQAPELVSLVLPHRVEVGVFFGNHSEMYAPPWIWDELLLAFRLLIKKCTERYRLAFFIDGMDEFQGNPTDLIEFITSLIAPGTKVCVSSRPWVVFEDAFGRRPHLRLENLTHADIKHYVTSKMTTSPGFGALQNLDPEVSMELIEKVCRKSSGVFLWVTLVTQSLLEGLSPSERLFELQQRLDSLPDDLEELFEKILRSLSSKHFQRASEFFSLVRASLLPLSLLDMSFADEDDQDFAIKASPILLTENQSSSRAELMRRRISTCCKGLLEAKPGSNTKLADTKVEFLHRTVKDYLELTETSEKIRAAIRTNFNANLRLCNSQIMRAKRLHPEALDDTTLWNLTTYAIEYGVRSDPTCSGLQMALLNEIEKTAVALTTVPLRGGSTYLQLRSIDHWTYTRTECRSSKDFLGFAVLCQLTNYVDQVLREMLPRDATWESRRLINLASDDYCMFDDAIDRPSIHHRDRNKELIELLRGYDAAYAKKEFGEPMTDDPKPRSRLRRCFCFG
jgi:hypothetical protein